MTARRETGQTAVEVALLLPLVAVMVLAVVQAGLVLRDHLLVAHAAREAARAAAVEPEARVAFDAAREAGPLRADRLTVALGGGSERGDRAEVVVTYRSPTAVPLVGRLLGDVTVRAEATMRVE